MEMSDVLSTGLIALGTLGGVGVVAGAVALMMSRNPTLPVGQIESLLFSSAADLGAAGRDAVFGYGRVDAAAAVQAAGAAVSTVDTQVPAVSITAPGASQTVSGLVAVTANASDNVGVTRVDLRVNGSTVASDTSTPFSFAWDSSKVVNGMTTLTAVAFDAAGNSSSSSPVSVNVANVLVPDTTAPVLTIKNPVLGDTVSGTVQVRLEASDNSGSAGITQALYIDGKKVASAVGAALSYSWNTRKVASGPHAVTATARDAAGNSTTQTVSVTR